MEFREKRIEEKEGEGGGGRGGGRKRGGKGNKGGQVVLEKVKTRIKRTKRREL